ncbi:MAG TPA: hypothetical protein VGG29_07000, partial [Caulobacteraceae bacterium]|jgi:hypothetical protein
MTEAAARLPLARNPLKLRPPPFVALAYVLGPAAGLTVLWLLMLLDVIVEPGRGYSGMALLTFAFFYVYLVIIGVAVCVVFELVFITPLLVAFQRHRWRWLNGWTGAGIGFALGFLAALVVVVALPPLPNQTDWGMATLVNGHRTAAGWVLALAACAVVGVVGLVAAGVFRVIAVQHDPEAAP